MLLFKFIPKSYGLLFSQAAIDKFSRKQLLLNFSNIVSGNLDARDAY